MFIITQWYCMVLFFLMRCCRTQTLQQKSRIAIIICHLMVKTVATVCVSVFFESSAALVPTGMICPTVNMVLAQNKICHLHLIKFWKAEQGFMWAPGQNLSVDLVSRLGGLGGLISDSTSLAYLLWCRPASHRACSTRTLGSHTIWKTDVKINPQ